MHRVVAVIAAILICLTAGLAMAAYHHEGEQDAAKFLAVYPDLAGTKLDHCALCHTGGKQERNGKSYSLGSCQWCHATYGYDGSGNIVETLNGYGLDYLVAGRSEKAVTTIGSKDSDGDGYTNQEEIAANRFPGNEDDDPTKVEAPYKVFSLADLQAMAAHRQFLLMNTSRSGDFYASYTGVVLEDLLKAAGILDGATGITVYAPDGWSQYHPLDEDPDQSLYHVRGDYPAAVYHYDEQADDALNLADGWCDYSAPSCVGRTNGDPIYNAAGLKMILAYLREGQPLEAGFLTGENKLDGEGPFRVIPPQRSTNPPDQSSTASNQSVIWPYMYDWDHNAGSASRSATIIRVEPLPEGTTDVDTLEAGWNYVDQNKILIYGAISGSAAE